MTNTYFKDIDIFLVGELMKAQLSIRAAVAWCTDPHIIRVLSILIDKGVNIELIVNDDKINRKSELSLLTSKGGKVFYADSTSDIMHCKFCIIDGICVVSGSYNWTKHAQSNDEQITVTTDDMTEVNKFQGMFDNIIRAIEEKHRLLAEEAEGSCVSKKVGNANYVKLFDSLLSNINISNRTVIRRNNVFTLDPMNERRVEIASRLLDTTKSNIVRCSIEIFFNMLQTQHPELWKDKEEFLSLLKGDYEREDKSSKTQFDLDSLFVYPIKAVDRREAFRGIIHFEA